jgi:Na+(H+)/acetate symporter ActP
MRSVTLVQAFHYWLKLAALLTPVFFIVAAVSRGGAPEAITRIDAGDWAEPLTGDYALYLTYSLVLATFFGTMGLPHVVVRFYTNPDGRAARRTTLVVLALLGGFYLLPVAYGVLGRMVASDLVATGRTDSVVLELPQRLFTGTLADLLTALIAAGAFAAFLSTSMGLVVSVAGVLSQDVLRRRIELGHGVGAFRLATLIAVGLALGLAFIAARVPVAHAVELAFAVAASTFCPMLVLGIWWRRLTAAGVISGLAVGGSLSLTAVATTMLDHRAEGVLGAILSQPAAVTMPLAFATMIGASLATRHRQPLHTAQTMVRLHAPEHLSLNRGPFTPEVGRVDRADRVDPADPDRVTVRR